MFLRERLGFRVRWMAGWMDRGRFVWEAEFLTRLEADDFVYQMDSVLGSRVVRPVWRWVCRYRMR